jgi:SAM-dependent methyltransferase
VLSTANPEALATLRRFLDETGFAYLSHRLIPGHDSILWPDFPVLHGALEQLNGIYRLLFTLLRQGHAADDDILKRALPPEVLEAFADTGLLRMNVDGQWQTPGLALLPVEGLLLAVSLPPHYPTAASPKQPVYIGMESLWLARALPGHLAGRRVLDLCAGSGLQGLLCAARGAGRVILLENHEEAIAAARFNAALNRLDGVVEVRASDLGAALAPDERFDLVACNPPFMPVMEGIGYPACGDGGLDGTTVLRRILRDLPHWLGNRGEAVIFCNALGGPSSIFLNREVLEPLARRHHLFIRAYVDDKHPLDDYVHGTLAGNLAHTCPELPAEDRRKRIAGWLRELRRRGVPTDYIYSQIVRIWSGHGRAGLAVLPAYDPARTDPLVSRVLRRREWS